MNTVSAKDEEEELDGCDIDFTVESQTDDADLPETYGGVGSVDKELDGCDIDFTAEAQTDDADLPETYGGVANAED